MQLRPALTVLAALAGTAAVVGYSASALSSDHLDAPGTTAAPTADIADVYSWMDNGQDGGAAGNVVLAMTTYPNAPSTAKFDNQVQYVLHTASGSTLGMPTKAVDIIATFDTNQHISLWVGTSEFVTGDASPASGLTSADGKVKVFAGLRADPFFFNIAGYKATVGAIEQAVGSGTVVFNDAGCPLLEAGTAAALGFQLAHAPDGGAPSSPFANFNSLAIVVSVDKSLLTGGGGGPLLSVWGATYSTASVVDAGGQ